MNHPRQHMRLRPCLRLLFITISLVASACASTPIAPVITNSATIVVDQPTAAPTVSENNTTAQPTELPAEDLIWQMLAEVDKERVLTDLRRLTGEEKICKDNKCYTISNRLTGSEGLQWAKEYVSDELVKVGYSVERNNWSLSDYSDQNLIARKQGISKPGEEIYFVAHLDGKRKTGLLRFPAADDNASGAVDILEVARVLSHYSLDRTLVFFFSSGEEEGRLGVNGYLDQLSSDDLSHIKYVVDVDMVGYDDNNDGVMELWHGDHPPSLALAELMNNTIQDYQLDLSPEFVVGCG